MFILSFFFIFAAVARRRTITTETSDFFQSLQDYDLFHFEPDHSPNFFHHVENRFYPNKGSLKFNAFGQDYHIELDKHHALFGEDFKITNNNGSHVTETEWNHKEKNCWYHGTVVNDDEPSTVAVMACQGNGVKGLVMGHGRTISIKPSLPHVDVNSDDTPTVHGEHLVYHIGDVDRKHDRNAASSTACDLGHELENFPEDMARLKENDPDLHAHIVEHHVKGHHHHHHSDHEHSDSSEEDSSDESDEHESHHHEDHHHHHGHHEHEDDMVKEINKYHEKIEKILTTKPAISRRELELNRAQDRYVEMLIVNDPARTISHFGCTQEGAESSGDDDPISVQCARLIEDTLSIFSIVTALYRDQHWDYNIQLVITHIQNWYNHECHNDADDTYCGSYTTQPMSVHNYKSANANNGGCISRSAWLFNPSQAANAPSSWQQDGTDHGDYCEASYIDYLSKFHTWRIRSGVAPSHDNAQLLSYYDFYSTVIGYATLRSMCGSYSGGINQMTYDQEYNAGIIAHEMGHNWGMRHDSDGNSCSPANFIMASTGSPNGFRPKDFSTCSIEYLDDFIESKGSQLVCLDNIPLPPEYSYCGNGFLEQGEQCDCGQSDCSSIDPCCDGSICALRAGSECSLGQPCCEQTTVSGVQTCRIVSADSEKVCRTKSDANTCDVSAETCDGVSAECPFDIFKLAGEACYTNGIGSLASPDGECWDGACRSQAAYCLSIGHSVCDVYQTRVEQCNVVKCRVYETNQCSIIGEDPASGISGNWPDGTPCTRDNGATLGLCESQTSGSSTCVAVSQMRSHTWWADPFGECSRSCYPAHCSYFNEAQCIQEGCLWDGACGLPAKGTQTRTVRCVNMAGEDATNADGDYDESLCTEQKPNSESLCNDFPCGNCDLDCGAEGQCIYVTGTNSTSNIATQAVKACLCSNGYAGDNCRTPPSVEFIGITSLKGADQTLDADPRCPAITPLIDGKTCSSFVYNGDMMGLTWKTGGSPEYFAIGVKEEGDEFAFYQNSILKPIFTNKVTASGPDGTIQCDATDDTSNYCQDGYFLWDPKEEYAGNYTLSVRYNNEATFETPVITVMCSEYICGAHGTCQNNKCKCEDGYGGPTCESLHCKDWIFINESIVEDATTTASYYVDRCHGHGTCNIADGSCDCDQGWIGSHCEVYNDTCGDDTDAQNACQHGSVRVMLGDQNHTCASNCDCDQINRQSDGATQHWTGAVCGICPISCPYGEVDADCTKCINCDDIYDGDRCNELFWVTHFKINIPYSKINTEDKVKFEDTLLKDIAYALNLNAFPTSRFGIYAMKPDGDATLIYFKIIFPTADTITAQSYGGDVMLRLQALADDSSSAFYRGMLTSYTDSSYGMSNACIPSFENCDPNVEDKFVDYLIYCFGGSFGFEILLIFIWHFWTKKKKWAKYQERVQKVHERLQKLQNQNEIRGGRQQFKLIPVSRKEARNIYKLRMEKEEREAKEKERQERMAEEKAKQRALEEEQGRQKAIEDVRKAEEQAMLMQQQQQRQRMPGEGVQPGSREGEPGHVEPGAIVYPPGAAVAASAPGMNIPGGRSDLPKGWVKYKSKTGIPYYYHKKSKKTFWQHPAELTAEQLQSTKTR